MEEWLNPSYCSGLEDSLGDSDAREYLRRLGLSVQKPSSTYLQALVEETYQHVAFQNFTMLVRPRIAPSWAQIVDDMISGLGGLCTTINPFMCALLHRLGFKAVLLSGAINGQSGSHIALGVAVDGELYWLDMANGFPYLSPLPVTHTTWSRTSGFEYGLESDGHNVQLIQTVLGTERIRCNQTISLIPVPYSHFDDMRYRHYNDPEFGPFLTHLRLNRWSRKGGVILRDNKVACYPEPWKTVGIDESLVWIRQHFENEVLMSLFKQAVERLNRDYDDGKSVFHFAE